MYILTDIEDDDRAATEKEISLLNELKLILLEITKEKHDSNKMTDADKSEKGELYLNYWR